MSAGAHPPATDFLPEPGLFLGGPDLAEPKARLASQMHGPLGRLLLTWLAVVGALGLTQLLGLHAALDTWLRQAIYRTDAQPAVLVTPLLRFLVVVPLSAALLLLLRRLHSMAVLGWAAATTVVLLGLDAGLEAFAHVRWGGAGPALAVAFSAVACWVQERRTALDRLVQLEDWLQRRARELDEQDAEAVRDALFREHFREICHCYAEDSASALLADLPPGRWHLEFRGYCNAAEDDVDEMRRDIRRQPYRDAFAQRRPVWCDEYMVPDLHVRSLLAPLVAGGRPVGLWVLNFKPGHEPDATQMMLVQRVAEHLAHQLQRRPGLDVAPVPRSWLERVLLPEPNVPEVVSVLKLTETVAMAQTWRAGLLADAPVGILAATLSGEIHYTNRALRDQLDASGGHLLGQTLVALLGTLSGLPPREVLARLRQVVGEGKAWRFSWCSQADAPGRAVTVQRWSEPSGDPTAAAAGPWRLVVMLLPVTPEPSGS